MGKSLCRVFFHLYCCTPVGRLLFTFLASRRVNLSFRQRYFYSIPPELHSKDFISQCLLICLCSIRLVVFFVYCYWICDKFNFFSEKLSRILLL
jgi:hypothetical protein